MSCLFITASSFLMNCLFSVGVESSFLILAVILSMSWQGDVTVCSPDIYKDGRV